MSGLSPTRVRSRAANNARWSAAAAAPTSAVLTDNPGADDLLRASDAAGPDHERRTGAASAAADCAQVSVRGQISHIEQRVVGVNASASLRPSAAPRSAQLGSSRGVGFSGGGGGGSGGDDDYMAPPHDDEDVMQPLQQPFVYDARDAQNFRRNPYAAANLAFARIGAFDDSISGRVMHTSTHPPRLPPDASAGAVAQPDRLRVLRYSDAAGAVLESVKPCDDVQTAARIERFSSIANRAPQHCAGCGIFTHDDTTLLILPALVPDDAAPPAASAAARAAQANLRRAALANARIADRFRLSAVQVARYNQLGPTADEPLDLRPALNVRRNITSPSHMTTTGHAHTH